MQTGQKETSSFVCWVLQRKIDLSWGMLETTTNDCGCRATAPLPHFLPFMPFMQKPGHQRIENGGSQETINLTVAFWSGSLLWLALLVLFFSPPHPPTPTFPLHFL